MSGEYESFEPKDIKEKLPQEPAKSPYEVLGVDKNANDDDIKKAFRSLSAIHHPDRTGDPEEMKKISAAYQTLKDPNKRYLQDIELASKQNSNPQVEKDNIRAATSRLVEAQKKERERESFERTQEQMQDIDARNAEILDRKEQERLAKEKKDQAILDQREARRKQLEEERIAKEKKDQAILEQREARKKQLEQERIAKEKMDQERRKAKNL